MYDNVMADKEMLHKLEKELEEIEIFLIGNKPKDDCEETSENCLKDTMRKNSQTIDRCLGVACSIKEILKGGTK